MANKPVATEKSARPAATPATPPAAKPVSPPPPQPFLQAPRDTTDNPWRDLHPLRVWPD